MLARNAKVGKIYVVSGSGTRIKIIRNRDDGRVSINCLVEVERQGRMLISQGTELELPKAGNKRKFITGAQARLERMKQDRELGRTKEKR